MTDHLQEYYSSEYLHRIINMFFSPDVILIINRILEVPNIIRLSEDSVKK